MGIAGMPHNGAGGGAVLGYELTGHINITASRRSKGFIEFPHYGGKYAGNKDL